MFVGQVRLISYLCDLTEVPFTTVVDVYFKYFILSLSLLNVCS
jgi:hypothetical protein